MTKSRADLLLSRADLVKTRADLFHSRADLFKTRADLTKTRADLFLSRAGPANSRADLAHSRAEAVDSRVRQATFPDDAARATGTAVLWAAAGFTVTAAAALLRRNAEDGVPAVVSSPLRKTAKHPLAGVLLGFVVRPFRLFFSVVVRPPRLLLLRRRPVDASGTPAPQGEEPGLRRGERKMGGERVRERGGKKRVGALIGVFPPLSCVCGRSAAALSRPRGAT